jgi:hypothetical protein
VINISRSKTQARHEVLGFKIRHFFENLSRGKAGCEEIENVTDANSHAPNARPASALFGIDRDSIGKLIHRASIATTIGITSAPVMLRQHAI